MTVAWSSTGNPGTSYNGATSLSWTHTSVGTPSCAIVTFSATFFPGSAVPTVTWDTGGSNTAMTSRGSKTATDFQGTLTGRVELFELGSPSSGAVTVAISSGGVGMYGGGAASRVYTGSSTSTGSILTNIQTPAEALSTAPGASMSGTTGNILIDVTAVGAGPYTTISADRDHGVAAKGGGGQAGGSQDAAAGSGISMTYTLDNLGLWIWMGGEIQVAGGGGGGGLIKTINGLAFASVKTRNGLAMSSVKTVNGLAAQ